MTGIGGDDPYPSRSKTTRVQLTPSTTPDVRAWSCAKSSTRWTITVAGPRRGPGHLSEAAAVRSVLWGVITLAEQAAELSDEQLRSRLVTLGGLVR